MSSYYHGNRLEAQNIRQRGNTLQAKIVINRYNENVDICATPELTINGAIRFQVIMIVAKTNIKLIFIKFTIHTDDELTYTIAVTSTSLKIENKVLHSEDGAWHLISELKSILNSFDVTVVTNVVQCSTFATLYDEEELMDFELRGEDGAVRVHRAVLAASSPVMRRMFSGGWRETAEGHVTVPDTSKKTLQHLKDFMYLHKLPDAGLKPILVLASYYMMPDLEQMCVDRLIAALTAENTTELLQFATKNRLTRLLLAVLECVQTGAIQVNEIRKHFMSDKAE